MYLVYSITQQEQRFRVKSHASRLPLIFGVKMFSHESQGKSSLKSTKAKLVSQAMIFNYSQYFYKKSYLCPYLIFFPKEL